MTQANAMRPDQTPKNMPRFRISQAKAPVIPPSLAGRMLALDRRITVAQKKRTQPCARFETSSVDKWQTRLQLAGSSSGRPSNFSSFRRSQAKSIDALKDAIAELDKRVQRLENREDILVTEAKSAARSASYEASTGVVGDLTRRVTLLEVGKPKSAAKRVRGPKAE